MAEILTESFCERCGTRYTFQSPPRGANPLGMLSTVGRGIRNYVAMPDASFNEAFAVARAETEQGATAHQLEAFQQTFNFCLSCRQYTCANCWNAIEGQCLSCSPLPESETRADAAVVAEAVPISISPGPAYPPGPADLAWPVLEVEDLPTGAQLETVPEEPDWVPTPVDGPNVLEDAVVEEAAEPEADAASVVVPVEAVAELVEPEVEVEAPPSQPEPPAPNMPAPSAAARRTSALPGFTPGASLDDEIAAYDLRVAALAAASPIATGPPASAEFEAPAIIASVIAPPASVTPPAAVARPESHLLPMEAIPETPPETASGAPTGTCPSCGLSLSASARFCRRCGTQQHP
jgi:hypothetical protein